MPKGAVRLRLSEILDELGWTQIELSIKAGISRTSISNLNRATGVKFTTLAALIEATGVPVEEWFIYEDPESN